MTTVVCVWVRGHVPFTLEYVVRLRSMVRRHLAREHRFVCLTDRPQFMPEGIEGVVIPSPKPLKGWWSKIHLFSPAVGLTGRVLYLDLDTLVVSSLDPILDYPAPFALAPDAGTFRPKGELQVVKRFNSSVMAWDAGVNHRLFEAWTPAVAERLWGDQDWIGEQLPEAAAMPIWWFPRLSELDGKPPSEAAKVVLAKKPKNDVAADLYPWFGQIWRAA